MTQIKRSFFTLIEVLVAMILLGILGGLLLFNTSGLLKSTRLDHEISGLIEELSLTQTFAQSHRGEIELTLTSSSSGLLLQREADEPMEKFRFLFRPITFSHLFLDEEKIIFQFSSEGTISPKPNLLINGEIEITFTPPILYKIKKTSLN